ncbi:Thioredoxin domain-containing protein 5 [Coemansia nantahalensis]|uniref:Thioredoxin domain-containing protein 5 n=2 Tax=Coemansia TaxID=4863 RepID=A0ACC1L0E5_9FUNG|nr:Thioredoxin domain-containing protein 5 [Coemansia nantahalensis]KAJ2798479.1 Thioredoxin domain-containing protein 5 [Coemansia helicoidea]
MKATLLTAALAAVASGYTVLDPSNFDSNIQDGYWLVKYYSSTCPWSRRFAPTWEQVYTSLETELAANDVKFGEVECKVNRALCDAANIDGYPTVVFYNNGENKGEVPGGQSFEALASFAKRI